MPSITVRNVPDEVHQGLRARASKHGRSAESEIRDILAKAVLPEGRVKLGSLLADMGKSARLSASDEEALSCLRDKTPAQPLDLE